MPVQEMNPELFEAAELEKILQGLKCGKAAGYNNIFPRIHEKSWLPSPNLVDTTLHKDHTNKLDPKEMAVNKGHCHTKTWQRPQTASKLPPNLPTQHSL